MNSTDIPAAILPRRLSEIELDASRALALRDWRPSDDVWVFAYGSLIFDPPFVVTHAEPAKVYGYHRALNVWSRIYRGTFEQPGLAVGLDLGGACCGMAVRIPASKVLSDLSLLWQREMPLSTYVPTWVSAYLHYPARQSRENASAPSAATKVRALTFVVNRAGANYTGRLSEMRLLEILCSTSGTKGSSRDYLLHTVEALGRYGIVDRGLAALAKKVAK